MSTHAVTVYSNSWDCTNGGVTSQPEGKRYIVVTDPKTDIAKIRSMHHGDKVEILVLVERTIGGEPYRHCVPLAFWEAGNKIGMAGGNFVYSCDSRFRQEVNTYPLPVHDRQEC